MNISKKATESQAANSKLNDLFLLIGLFNILFDLERVTLGLLFQSVALALWYQLRLL